MEWSKVKNLLCVRADNMGDVLMTSPSFRALKEQNPQRKITLLTSSMGAGIAKFIPEIDEVLVFDLPWVKMEKALDSGEVLRLVVELKKRQFDGSIIFTNFSQNPLPSAMLCFLAGIPKRLGYSRENPYELLTDWVPDKEPLSFIRHGVERQLALVETIGAKTAQTRLSLKVSDPARKKLVRKMEALGMDFSKPWLVVHTGISETKRQSPNGLLAKSCQALTNNYGFQIILTGLKNDQAKAREIMEAEGKIFSLVGKLELDELIVLIKMAPVLVSANSGPVHIASAVNTPVVVLYAQTNPEHTPWMVKSEVLYFSVPKSQQSKNQLLKFVTPDTKQLVGPEDIVQAVLRLYKGCRERESNPHSL